MCNRNFTWEPVSTHSPPSGKLHFWTLSSELGRLLNRVHQLRKIIFIFHVVTNSSNANWYLVPLYKHIWRRYCCNWLNESGMFIAFISLPDLFYFEYDCLKWVWPYYIWKGWIVAWAPAISDNAGPYRSRRKRSHGLTLSILSEAVMVASSILPCIPVQLSSYCIPQDDQVKSFAIDKCVWWRTRWIRHKAEWQLSLKCLIIPTLYGMFYNFLLWLFCRVKQ
jgi:hypothetical protein